MNGVDPAALVAAMTAWRHDLHAHPEFGFEERRTAGFVAATLRGLGLDVAEGLGGTGVVGTLRRGAGPRTIALRADMDALRIAEQGTQAYRSTVPGTMHACGHDGHTAMLLGAARLLATEGGFDGTVRFLFQPAEEWGQGAAAMLADGLLERFPFDEIYGLHTMPGRPLGHVDTRPGPIMAAEDGFEITLGGLGGHAGRPHQSREVLVAACALVLGLQTIVSRRIDPAEAAVVSVTELITDGTRNALAGSALIRGDARSFRPETSRMIERDIRRMAEGTALTHACSATVSYTPLFVPVVNDPALVAEVVAAARTALDPGMVSGATEPITGSEDFARFLAHRPGCFSFLGNGEGSRPLHNPAFDFDDAALLPGALLQAAIVRRRLPIASAA